MWQPQAVGRILQSPQWRQPAAGRTLQIPNGDRQQPGSHGWLDGLEPPTETGIDQDDVGTSGGDEPDSVETSG